MLSRDVSPESRPPEALRLRAGPLTILFEPHTAFVRQICLGQREVLRGIYMAVRDRNWGTVPAGVESLAKDIRADAFDLSFTVDCRTAGIHFRWRGQLSGAADGTVRFLFDGEALTMFLRNRIGFCVLHPLRECCGAPARYTRSDGQRVELRFPTAIEPQIFGQSTFRDMRSLAYEIHPGCWAELEFEGDVFEMEDQRNWTDASFKTYCTPLALPFPVEIKAGTRIQQAVTLRLVPADAPLALGTEIARRVPVVEATRVTSEVESDSDRLELVLPQQPAGALRRLGLGVASHGAPLNPQEVARLSALQLSHLRADLRLAEPGWPEALSRASTQVRQLGAALELVLYLGADGSESALTKCGVILKRTRIPVARVLVFRQAEPATSLATIQLARRHLGGLGVKLGAGTDAHFCELNREQALGRFGLAEADFISWPMTPQVHAFDDRSMMETLQAQPDTVATARAFAGNRPLAVSPITLRPRFNAVATSEESLEPEGLPSQVDPRQLSMFNAAWTLGSLAGLAGTNVESLTYFETTGWRGLMETCSPSPFPALFPSVPGMLFPVYHVFAALAGFSQVAPVLMEQRHQAALAALYVFDGQGQRRFLCADLTGKGLQFSVHFQAERVSLRVLRADGWDPCAAEAGPMLSLAGQQSASRRGIQTLILPPYGITSLDLA